MKPLLILPATLLSWALLAQSLSNDPDYRRAVEIALGELQKGQCLPCLEAYERAFAISRHSALSHLRAARCAQMCHDERKAAAFAQKAVEISFGNAEQVLSHPADYPELAPFRSSDLGRQTLEKIYSAAMAAGFNLQLAKTLDSLLADDQRPRVAHDSVRARYPQDSPEYRQFMRDWERSDSICLVKAEAILKQYGYPGKTLVGGERQDIIWLVIQHAPLDKQEHYLPLLDEAAQKGELRKSSLAYLTDRIRMRKGQPQLYGSQVVRDELNGGWKFYDIEDEANVNQRRANVGLGPLEEYAQKMGVAWKPK